MGIGSNLGHVDRLFLFVDSNIVDSSFAAIFLSVGNEKVAVVEKMEGTVAREEKLSTGNEGEDAAFGDVEGVAAGGYEGIGYGEGIDVMVGEFELVVAVEAVNGMETDVFEGGVGTLEVCSGHTVKAFVAFAEGKGFGALCFHTLAVVEGKEFVIPLPSVLVNPS